MCLEHALAIDFFRSTREQGIWVSVARDFAVGLPPALRISSRLYAEAENILVIAS
jgi:hypothetical protein